MRDDTVQTGKRERF